MSSSLPTLGKPMMDKFGLVPYHDKQAPALFFGCYVPRDIAAITRHKSIAVVLWGGTDAMKSLTMRAKYLKKPNIFHIAESDFIEKDLQKAGLKYKRVNMSYHRHVSNPKPLGDSVYLYASCKGREKFYGHDVFMQLKEEMPHIKFIFSRQFQYDRDTEMPAIYEQCFINLRLTPHDGLSSTVVEAGLMGRKSVYNNTFPGAYRWKNKEDIKEAILKEHANIGKTNIELVKEIEDYLDIGTDWLTTKFWTG